MKTFLMIMFGVALSFSLVSAQAPSGKAIERLDPALDQIVSANAKLELLKLDLDSKLLRISDRIIFNNWLTGAIGVILVTQAIYNVFKG